MRTELPSETTIIPLLRLVNCVFKNEMNIIVSDNRFKKIYEIKCTSVQDSTYDSDEEKRAIQVVYMGDELFLEQLDRLKILAEKSRKVADELLKDTDLLTLVDLLSLK